jgi:ferredoxin
LTTLLAGGALYAGLAFGLVTVLLTLVFGRVFCGWICPLGTLQQIAGWFRRGRGAGRRREANRYHPAQKIKYGVLLAGLGAALAGSTIVTLLDPIGIASRGVGLAVLPAVGRGARQMMDAAYASDTPVRYAGEGFRFLMAEGYLPYRDAAYQSAALIGAVLIAVLALAWVRPRFFCRFLCPLGALLGMLSRFSILRLRKAEGTCTSCRKCLDHCQGADGPEASAPWRESECHKCLNCVAACPERSGLAFRFGLDGLAPSPATACGETDGGGEASAPPEPAAARIPGPGLSRRTWIASIAAGAAAVPLLRVSPADRAAPDPKRIRPPGARREDLFLERCVRCGACMKVCPTTAIQPAVSEAGIEGFWTPVVVPRIGACQPGCNLCGQVCPTGAIREFPPDRKLGLGGDPAIRIGLARVDRGGCLAWAADTPCGVCEEFCPTSPKAIWLDEAESGVGRPVVDPTLCVGCGNCEHVCPMSPPPAIEVTATNESRADERDPLSS